MIILSNCNYQAAASKRSVNGGSFQGDNENKALEWIVQMQVQRPRGRSCLSPRSWWWCTVSFPLLQQMSITAKTSFKPFDDFVMFAKKSLSHRQNRFPKAGHSLAFKTMSQRHLGPSFKSMHLLCAIIWVLTLSMNSFVHILDTHKFSWWT